MSEEKKQVEQIGEKFLKEFEPFVDLRNKINSLSLSVAENLQREISEFKTKHTGKKSEIANAKKLIGRVAPEERGAFGQLVQSVEKKIVSKIEEAENNLNELYFRSQNRTRTIGRNASRSPSACRASASVDASPPTHRRHFRFDGLSHRGRPRDRNRLLQFRRAQYSRRSSGA